jgi:superfamily II DNA or RNA helicase
MIEIIKFNELYVKLKCDRSVEYEISNHFSFFVPDHQFMPAFKHGDWDGKIHLYNTQRHTFPIGLLAALVKLAKQNDWGLVIDRALMPIDFDSNLESFNSEVLPNLEMEPYGYQLDTFIRCIKNNRALVLSPTGSGKSFIIYLIVRFMLLYTEEKIVISVPSTNLVKQMHTDFCQYEDDGFVCDQCYEMSASQPKVTDKRVIIATWAMLMRRDSSFFAEYQTYICDEAHQADSQALGKIIQNLQHAKYRFGFTGTLDGSRSHEMQCRAWFGSIIKSSNTRSLIDQGILSPLTVRCISLEYSESDCKYAKGLKYQKEIEFIVNHEKRNDWLINLAMSQDQNTMLLFNLVDKHGMILFEKAKSQAEKYGKQVHLIVGDINADDREDIRQIMEKNNDVVVFASFGTMSVGVNIRNLHNLILAHPFKARIRTLQSIGRTLRKLEGLTSQAKNAIIIDVIDNLSIGKHQNTVFKHGIQRMRIYEAESFESTYERVPL